MREPTEAQMSRAHAAFEAMSAEWTIRTVNNYGLAHDTYVLEHNPPYAYVTGKHAVDNIAAHKFEGPNAKQQALFMKRDKCLREVLRAVAAMEE
jgi:hypothetical protein